jgi:glucoamylase
VNFVVTLLILSLNTDARPSAAASPAEQWLSQQAPKALQKIRENISPGDTRPGAVIAARTRKDPNYYYHWVRDAGIVFDAVLAKPEPVDFKKSREYAKFSKFIQERPAKGEATTGLGEPKFEVDGSPYVDGWGRPQNDGPALRVVSLIPLVHERLAAGDHNYVRDYLYRAEIPANTVLKRDLEYISHHWRDSNFDIWEEVKGDHFYTRMVQLRALNEGASLARELGDPAAAAWYSAQAAAIRQTLPQFWDAGRGYFVATLNRTGGLDYKSSNLDSAVILALLHGKAAQNFISFSDPRVWSTVEKLAETFKQIYPVNQVSGRPGVAIGRYPEDRYGGAHFNGGNPWPLTTLALAEVAYEAAAELAAKGDLTLARNRAAFADEMVLRVKLHGHSDGSLNEQIDRDTGYMTSVADLTWNYAAVLTTARARFDATSIAEP